MAGLALAGKYRQVWRSFGAPELLGILKGISIGVAASALVILGLYRFIGFSRVVFAIDAALLACLLVGSRLAITSADEYLRRRRGVGRSALIYGAGTGGTLLVHALLEDRSLALVPLGFIDDDRAKRRLRLEGVPVLGTLDDLRRPHRAARDCRGAREHQAASTGRASRKPPRSAASAAWRFA